MEILYIGHSLMGIGGVYSLFTSYKSSSFWQNPPNRFFSSFFKFDRILSQIQNSRENFLSCFRIQESDLKPFITQHPCTITIGIQRSSIQKKCLQSWYSHTIHKIHVYSYSFRQLLLFVDINHMTPNFYRLNDSIKGGVINLDVRINFSIKIYRFILYDRLRPPSIKNGYRYKHQQNLIFEEFKEEYQDFETFLCGVKKLNFFFFILAKTVLKRFLRGLVDNVIRNLWKRIQKGLPRSNNSLEAWYKSLSQDVGSHPNVNKLAEHLKNEQHLTDVLIEQINSGIVYPREKSEIKKDNEIMLIITVEIMDCKEKTMFRLKSLKILPHLFTVATRRSGSTTFIRIRVTHITLIILPPQQIILLQQLKKLFLQLADLIETLLFKTSPLAPLVTVVICRFHLDPFIVPIEQSQRIAMVRYQLFALLHAFVIAAQIAGKGRLHAQRCRHCHYGLNNMKYACHNQHLANLNING
ncbi:hypothetical protein BpHYR1_019220 [Brachionus plicatilis]|uniref:Uncharacterized protein n=1 Tax=Brachionus plicatilis TaxID=10195 RepID=A0A3M7QIC3_BRAPC|nr:hypothetical protein BpHYR1_019220 [Brachionus plicatilis]